MQIPVFHLRFFVEKDEFGFEKFFSIGESSHDNYPKQNSSVDLILRNQEEFVQEMNKAIAAFVRNAKVKEQDKINKFKNQLKTVGYWHGLIWNTMVRNNHSMKWFEIEKEAKQHLSELDMGQLKAIFDLEKAQWETRNNPKEEK